MTPPSIFRIPAVNPNISIHQISFCFLSSYGIAHPKNQSIDSLMLAQRSENDPIVRWFKVWSFSDVFFFIFS